MRGSHILVIAMGIGGAGLAYAYGPDFDAPGIAARIRAAGTLGPIALAGMFVLQCVVAPLPSEPVMMAAGYVYGPGPGFALSWLGVVVGAAACFGLARAFGRPLVTRFVSHERLDAVDEFVGARGARVTFAAVLALRVLSFHSFDVLSYACGLVCFPFRWFLIATAVGVVPKAFAFTYLGATIGARPGWLDAVILIGSFGVLALLPFAKKIRNSKVAKFEKN
jgi:uncharacterized membrane protein YdjX (TVP38/TMEM64 family)